MNVVYFRLLCLIAVCAVCSFYFFTRTDTVDYGYTTEKIIKIDSTRNSIFRTFNFLGPFPEPIHIAETFLENQTTWDFFISSSYYYPTSESLGDNSIAMVLSVHRTIDLKSINVRAWSGKKYKIVELPLTRIKNNDTYLCKWYPYVAIAPVLPQLTALTFRQEGKEFAIPYNRPVYEKHDVVTCISPVFANEQWQEMMFALHIYKQYGSHVHLYVRSALSGVFDLLKIYEKEGFATVESYARYGLSSIYSQNFNPNEELEYRGQDAAQTDCLLKYKESATYISFMDLDDVVIPKYGKNYFEEFNYLFAEQPESAYFRYQKWNAEYRITRNESDFSVGRMISSLSYGNVTEFGKYVIRPRSANSSWIHWPTNSHLLVWKDLSPRFAAITHLKNLVVDEEFFTSDNFTLMAPEYDPELLADPWYDNRLMDSPAVMNQTDLEAIDRDFIRMYSRPDMVAARTQLPNSSFYGPLISKCYKELYYDASTWEDWKCTNPDRCKLPVRPGIACMNTKAKYSSILGENRINLHFATETWFQEENGCSP